jgi:2-polyprenyl-3-methyl-5-hydroxy-6-metoxy-1,4-benzoquinol methylase
MNDEESYYQRTRPEMMPFISTDARTILEVGCAEGGFGASLKRRRPNIEVWGVEVLPEVAMKARASLDRMLVGRIEELVPSIPDKYFDCVVLNDVLEHLVDPWAVLIELRAKLTGTGSIVASIPNVRHFLNLKNLLLRKDWEYTEHGILDRTHLRFFTSKSIRRMFNECGYELASMQGIEAAGGVSWKFTIFNRLLLNSFDDARFLVFACVAWPRNAQPHP